MQPLKIMAAHIIFLLNFKNVFEILLNFCSFQINFTTCRLTCQYFFAQTVQNYVCFRFYSMLYIKK